MTAATGATLHFFHAKDRDMSTNRRARKGQGLVEYIVITASVALIALVAVSMFGHKVASQYGIAAGMLPGASSESNQAVAVGYFAEVDGGSGTSQGNGRVSWDSITGNSDATQLNNNVKVLGMNDGSAFVAELD